MATIKIVMNILSTLISNYVGSANKSDSLFMLLFLFFLDLLLLWALLYIGGYIINYNVIKNQKLIIKQLEAQNNIIYTNSCRLIEQIEQLDKQTVNKENK